MMNKLTTTTSLSLAASAALRGVSQYGLLILVNSTTAVVMTCAFVGVLNAQQPRAVSEQQKFQSNLQAAIRGDLTAQGKIGYAYEFGKGTEKDLEQAVVWYRKAALQGSASGQYNLGDMYEDGKGVEKDLAQAAQWYRKAANQGHTLAQSNLGSCYRSGRGVQKDNAEAFKWYEKASQSSIRALRYCCAIGIELHGEDYPLVMLSRLLQEPPTAKTAEKIEQLAKPSSEVVQEKILLQLLSLREKIHGTKDQKTLAVRAALSRCLKVFGEHERRLALIETNVQVAKVEFGDSSPEYASQLVELGMVHADLTSFENAIVCFETTIQISASINDRRAESDKDMSLGYCARRELGEVYLSKGQYRKALALFQQCAALDKEIGEPFFLDSCGYFRTELGHAKSIFYADACVLRALVKLRRFPEAIELANAENLFTRDAAKAWLVQNTGKQLPTRFVDSDSSFSEICATIGLDSLNRVEADRRSSANFIRDTHLYSERWKEAVEAQEEIHRELTKYTMKQVVILSNHRRRNFLANEYRPSFERALSLGLNQRKNQRSATLSAGWLLNGKGLVQEALAEASLLSSAQATPFVNKLKMVRSKLGSVTMSEGLANQSARTQIAALEAEQRQLEDKIAQLGLGTAKRRNWTPIGRLMTELPADTCFVSIAKFRPIDMKATFENLEDTWLPERYVAWIVPSVGMGAVQCVALGAAEMIDQEVAKVRRELNETAGKIGNLSELDLESQLRVPLAELSALVFKPLEPHLGEAAELIISPDGELWAIPWELLLTNVTGDNQSYLIETKRIRYAMSGRELVNPLEAYSLVSNPVVFANADYDLSTEWIKGVPQEQLAMRSANNMKFSALGFSAAEAKAITPLVEKYTGDKSRTFLAADAQEANFKNLHRPRVVAISTHGFFDSDKKVSDPLLRCGLALAGANNRQKAMAQGKEDGILTGLEIVGTDLRGTELVVLSACETGLGEVTSGEGVAGLRQAFQLAGAQSVVSSLWQVEDGETARLMKLFFQNLADGKSKSEALRQAQLSRIKARSARYGAAHPFFWAAFTLTGQD